MGRKEKKEIDETLELPKVQEVKGTTAKEEYNSDYCKMYQGTATNKLSGVSSKDIKYENYSKEGVIEADGLKVFFQEHNKLKANLRISTQKLLDYGIIELTRQNNYRDKNKTKMITSVSFPLKEYAMDLGYDVIEKYIENEVERKKEALRVKRIIDNVRRRINEDLEVLFSMRLSWTEPKGGSKGKSLDYTDVRLLQSKGIKSGVVNIKFTEDITLYLTNAYVTQYPKALFKLDERNPVAYQIGYKLALHNGIKNNIIKRTQNIIKVETLLKASGSIATIKEVNEKDPGHWDRRIKEPLEKSLQDLLDNEMLDYWEYSNSKAIPLTNEQAEFRTYDDFIKLYIHFDLKNKKK